MQRNIRNACIIQVHAIVHKSLNLSVRDIIYGQSCIFTAYTHGGLAVNSLREITTSCRDDTSHSSSE